MKPRRLHQHPAGSVGRVGCGRGGVWWRAVNGAAPTTSASCGGVCEGRMNGCESSRVPLRGRARSRRDANGRELGWMPTKMARGSFSGTHRSSSPIRVRSTSLPRPMAPMSFSHVASPSPATATPALGGGSSVPCRSEGREWRGGVGWGGEGGDGRGGWEGEGAGGDGRGGWGGEGDTSRQGWAGSDVVWCRGAPGPHTHLGSS